MVGTAPGLWRRSLSAKPAALATEDRDSCADPFLNQQVHHERLQRVRLPDSD
jgi:hypothetical protein